MVDTGRRKYSNQLLPHYTWPYTICLRGVVRSTDWLSHELTDQLPPAALLWLVVQVIPQSFAARDKNRYPRPSSQVSAISGYSLLPLHDWPVWYPEEYLQMQTSSAFPSNSISISNSCCGNSPTFAFLKNKANVRTGNQIQYRRKAE